MKQNEKGFTIVEILGVAVIITLAFMLTAFTVYQGLDSAAVNSAGRTILAVGKYGRLMACEKRRPCRLNIDTDNSTFWLSTTETTQPVSDCYKNTKISSHSSASENIPNIYQQPQSLPRNVQFGQIQIDDQIVETATAVIIFRPDGSADAAKIQIEAKNEKQTVLIDPWTAQGRIRSDEKEKL